VGPRADLNVMETRKYLVLAWNRNPIPRSSCPYLDNLNLYPAINDIQFNSWVVEF
jgi:hypothetical protein